MKYDLKKPCKNCPFRSDDTRIVFKDKERAAEIAEHAYRNGFPCHLSADFDEGDEEGKGAGYVAGRNSQHCAGAIIMFIKEGCYETGWPGIGNNERLYDKLAAQMDMDSPVFDSEEDFIKANDPRKHPARYRQRMKA